MSTAGDQSSREQRLAARLRENLKRRKAQQRARAAAGSDDSPPERAPKPREGPGEDTPAGSGEHPAAPPAGIARAPGSGLPKREDGG